MTFTAILVEILSVVIVVQFLSSREKVQTSKEEAKPSSRSKPWVDEDLKDDTEITSKDEGIFCVPPWEEIALLF